MNGATRRRGRGVAVIGSGEGGTPLQERVCAASERDVHKL